MKSVSKACQVAGLASSSYYYKLDAQHRRRREVEDEKLREKIERIHEEFPGYTVTGALHGNWNAVAIASMRNGSAV